MPKFGQVLSSVGRKIINEVTNNDKPNMSTLESCIESLSNNGIKLYKVGQSTPLSNSELKAMKPDLGELHFNGDLKTICLNKFLEHTSLVAQPTFLNTANSESVIQQPLQSDYLTNLDQRIEAFAQTGSSFCKKSDSSEVSEADFSAMLASFKAANSNIVTKFAAENNLAPCFANPSNSIYGFTNNGDSAFTFKDSINQFLAGGLSFCNTSETSAVANDYLASKISSFEQSHSNVMVNFAADSGIMPCPYLVEQASITDAKSEL